MGAMYMINDKTLRITVQLQPIEIKKIKNLKLKIFENNANSGEIIVIDQHSKINDSDLSATFTIENWDSSKKYSYTISCDIEDNEYSPCIYNGRIRKEPNAQAKLKMVALSMDNHINNQKEDNFSEVNSLFPYTKIINHIVSQNADIICIMNNNNNLDSSDFLYQQSLFYRAYNKILSNTPVIYLNKKERQIQYSNISFAIFDDFQTSNLNQWQFDWSKYTMFKVALTQKLFNLTNIQRKDLTKRNILLDAFRKDFVFSIALNENIGGLIHNGIDKWKDSGITFSIPQINPKEINLWEPTIKMIKENNNLIICKDDDFFDSNNNRFSMLNIAQSMPLKENNINQGGYGVITFNKEDRTIDIQCFSLDNQEDATWQRNIKIENNYAREIQGYLPQIMVRGIEDPIVTIINEKNNEIVYSRRIKGKSFTPFIFEKGIYSIKIGDENKKFQLIEHIQSTKIKNSEKVYFSF